MVILVNIPRELNVIIYATLAINQPSHNTTTTTTTTTTTRRRRRRTRTARRIKAIGSHVRVLSVFVCANVVADVAVVFVNLVMAVVLLALVLVLLLVFLSEFSQMS